MSLSELRNTLKEYNIKTQGHGYNITFVKNNYLISIYKNVDNMFVVYVGDHCSRGNGVTSQYDNINDLILRLEDLGLIQPTGHNIKG